MSYKHLEGRSLFYAARYTSFHRQTFRVFVLPYLPLATNCPEPGLQVAQDYTLAHILWEHPELATARIFRVEDYYGQIILRVVPDKDD